MHLAQWIGLEYREKVHEKIQRKGRYLLFWDRAQTEELEEQFNKEAKEGWRFAADAARITGERVSGEDRKRTSRGVFVAVDKNLGAVVGAEEGTTVSISGNERRNAQALVNVRGGFRVFSVYFWHSEDWIPRNEALLEGVVKQATTTRHPWLVTCDANMWPGYFEKGLWFRRERMHVAAPQEVSTCKSKDPQGEWIEKI